MALCACWKNGLESQKTTARVPLCSHGLSRLAHLARSLPLLLLASARAALEVHLGHTEEVSCAHGGALGRPHRSRVHPHGMPSEGGNKAKSSEMMDQKAEEAAVGRGSAPELRISTVLGWMPKELSIALRVGSRAWPNAAIHSIGWPISLGSGVINLAGCPCTYHHKITPQHRRA